MPPPKADPAFLRLVKSGDSTVYNEGLGACGPFKVSLYENTTPADGDTPPKFVLVDQKTVLALCGKDDGVLYPSSEDVSFNWTPNSGGKHLLKVVADSENVTIETNETNNDDFANVTVALPDLKPKLEVPEKVYKNKLTNVSVDITNNESEGTGDFQVTLLENCSSPDENNDMNFTIIGTQRVQGLLENSTSKIKFNWTPSTNGEHVLRVFVDSLGEVTESNETNNNDTKTIDVEKEKMHLYNTEMFPSTSDPNGYSAATYYYEADEPVYLNPGARTPTFVFKTTDPVYSDVGFQAWYPYGAIWLSFSNSSDGPWTSAFSNPYVYCGANTSEYEVAHWASGSGYYKYFKVHIRTKPTLGSSGLLKTFIEGFEIK
ncbi:CARDB domain-containing protein [Methanobacterium alcaliphilum]|uniref:CARDB domain-containing protein n=1 Tax=Methanobacterium alcaliphilum TaxID=392018 RepID=UPI002009E03C|nr:hypothetical protein [Methanobacterium alcaliphilum]